MAVHMVYGNAQARGQIGATTAVLCHSHSHARSECVCELHRSSWQHWILNPLSGARDQIGILMNISCILNLLSQNGNS